MLGSKKRILVFAGLSLVIAVFTLINYRYVETVARENTFQDVIQVPHHRVALVLGTAKYLAGGQVNLYYRYRIEVALELYHADKVDYLLLSGDNGSKDYNEPATMQDDLVAAGVPPERIFLDYAGFRTLDSVVRAKAIFGETELICISQPFHLARAIYIGQQKGIQLTGFSAKAVSAQYGWKVQVREYLARVKMQLDLWFGKEPRFYGPPVQIG